jgi:hypothetical protein
MDLANMRSLGVRSIFATCDCDRSASQEGARRVPSERASHQASLEARIWKADSDDARGPAQQSLHGGGRSGGGGGGRVVITVTVFAED